MPASEQEVSLVLAKGPVIPNFGTGSKCETENHTFCWGWVHAHWGDTLEPALLQHLKFTGIAVSIGFAIAFTAALVAYRYRRLDHPIGLVSDFLYTIPSLALFQLLVPLTGLTVTTVEIALVSYTLLILYRNMVAGLRGVPPDALEAARGMGLTRAQTFWRVELPLAVPAIVAIEIVETIAIRSPATIAGSASGSSTRHRSCRGVSPIPRAASSTSGGAERSPATMFGYRITSE